LAEQILPLHNICVCCMSLRALDVPSRSTVVEVEVWVVAAVWVVGGDLKARGEQDEAVGARNKIIKKVPSGLVARVRDQ
jgi:hypothetical protein